MQDITSLYNELCILAGISVVCGNKKIKIIGLCMPIRLVSDGLNYLLIKFISTKNKKGLRVNATPGTLLPSLPDLNQRPSKKTSP